MDPAVRRRRARAGLGIVAVGFALLWWSSCVSTVTPPADPPDPVTVRLLSTGRHAGVLLPCPDGRLVEYGYGDWGWYALLENDWWRAPATLLWPNPGTIGRRYESEAGLAAMGESYGGGTLAPFAVSRERAARLLARLDAEFAAGGEPHFNALYDMHFARHPDRFWAFHDCHDEVAEWLEELGCEVGSAPLRRGLRLADPQLEAR